MGILMINLLIKVIYFVNINLFLLFLWLSIPSVSYYLSTSSPWPRGWSPDLEFWCTWDPLIIHHYVSHISINSYVLCSQTNCWRLNFLLVDFLSSHQLCYDIALPCCWGVFCGAIVNGLSHGQWCLHMCYSPRQFFCRGRCCTAHKNSSYG